MGLFDFLKFDVFAYFFPGGFPDRWFFIDNHLSLRMPGMRLSTLI